MPPWLERRHTHVTTEGQGRASAEGQAQEQREPPKPGRTPDLFLEDTKKHWGRMGWMGDAGGVDYTSPSVAHGG